LKHINHRLKVADMNKPVAKKTQAKIGIFGIGLAAY
jgi:hypothetical protein